MMTSRDDLREALVGTCMGLAADGHREGAERMADLLLDGVVEGYVRTLLSEARSDYYKPDEVERPKTVGDIRRAVAGLPDDAQAFVNVSGHGEDYAIEDVFPSKQIPDGESWPTDKRTIGLEISLGLFKVAVDE
jgi:hypothetical protein